MMFSKTKIECQLTIYIFFFLNCHLNVICLVVYVISICKVNLMAGSHINFVSKNVINYLFCRSAYSLIVSSKWLIVSTLKKIDLNVPCGSWCEQSIGTIVGRIGVISTELQSLCKNQGPMGPRAPAIWFKCQMTCSFCLHKSQYMSKYELCVNWHAIYFCVSFCVSNIQNLVKLCQKYTLLIVSLRLPFQTELHNASLSILLCS